MLLTSRTGRVVAPRPRRLDGGLALGQRERGGHEGAHEPELVVEGLLVDQVGHGQHQGQPAQQLVDAGRRRHTAYAATATTPTMAAPVTQNGSVTPCSLRA